jgi:carboxymethylenebutenolidase
MPRATIFLLAFVIASGCKRGSAGVRGEPIAEHDSAGSPPPLLTAGKETVTFQNGDLTLHGVVFKPVGSRVFPAILWNHGSYGDPMVAFDELGPLFASRGWAFFGPFRRGQGLSASAGPYIGDELERAGKQGGIRAKAKAMVTLLTGDHLEDQVAAYRWLKQQPFVAANRIAVAGNSFGGIEAVLGAERIPFCAAVDAAGAAQSWDIAPELHDVMLRAARASHAPMFLFQAENDFDLSPSRTLATAMRDAGKTVEIKFYPPFGKSRADGHSFAWHGSSVWAGDVLAFLERHCGE